MIPSSYLQNTDTLVGSKESIKFAYDHLERESIDSIEFDRNQSVGTIDISKSIDSIESIIFECNRSVTNLRHI